MRLPGISIGSIDGEQINAVQRLLSDYVIENRLPNKILLVHQFLDEMVPNKQLVTNFPGVDVVFDMDGFGDSATKIFKYRRYAVEEPARYRGN